MWVRPELGSRTLSLLETAASIAVQALGEGIFGLPAIRLDPGVGSPFEWASVDNITTDTSPDFESIRDLCSVSIGHTFMYTFRGRGSLEHGDTGHPGIGTDRSCT